MLQKTLLYLLLSCALLCGSLLTRAQNLRPVYTDPDSLFRENESTLYFQLQNVNFFKNNEYFGEVIPGYTLPGADLSPSLVYAPNGRIKLEAGLQAQVLFGDQRQVRTAPRLRLHWGATDWLHVVMGSLYSHSAHQLAEPLMNPERSLHHLRETGLQFLLKHRYLEADAWVSWDDFIWFRDAKNEKVWGGMSARVKFGGWAKGLSIPLMVTANHSGGQIDWTSNPATTDLNIGLGLRYRREKLGWLDALEISSMGLTFGTDKPQDYNYFGPQRLLARNVFTYLNNNRYYLNDERSRPTRILFDHGYGSLSRLSVEKGSWQHTLEYWYGYNFWSPRGDYMYHNVSPFDESKLSTRSFVRWHGAYERKFYGSLRAAVALDVFYLVEEKSTDVAMGIYLFFDELIPLGRLPKR